MNKRILITGVAGFIGSHVAKKFIEKGFDVFGVDDLSNGFEENIPEGLNFFKQDLSSKNTIDLLPENCSIILHLAGQSSGEISYDDPVADLEKNVVSTLNLIKYGIKNKSQKIVYASSMSVYGNVPDEPIKEEYAPKPLSGYGVGKLASEGYLKVYQDKLPYVALRMFNVYGPGQDLSNLRQGMVSIYLSQALKSGNIQVKGSLNRYRDFIHVSDVVDCWYKAASDTNVRNIAINIGTGKRTTVESLLNKICSHIPNSQYFVTESTPGDQNGIYANNEQLKNLLGKDHFIDIDNGFADFSNWAIKNKDKIFSNNKNIE
jgi:UDP-glucose 4-epimerase